MEVLFVASEVAPWSKTGGLGDVAAALPAALAARGHAVTVVSPRYGSIDPRAAGFTRRDGLLRVRGEVASAWVRRGTPTFWLVEHERLFGSRPGIYGERGRDYPDNAERFTFLSRAALALPGATGTRPRVVHANDWQAGLVAFLLRREHGDDAHLAGARTVFTIHNLAYQGVFPKAVVPHLGLPWDAFRLDAMEFYDQLSFIKAGLVFADVLTTVSPTYAREIRTPQGGHGLDALLRARAADLHGILNGIDAAAWDPAADPHLPAHFSARALAGKARCKAALQREVGLPVRSEVPLAAMVSRLADQKGVDLLVAALPELLARDVQLVVLGSGEARYEQALAHAAAERRAQMAVRIGFDEGLAHRIEAGADVFLMPSRFEPCGLNQLYSLRYGTVPVVRAVGGLDDTVEDYDGWNAGTGFKFREYAPAALSLAFRRALDVFRDRRAWRGLVTRGMAEDFSWARSAAGYEAIYRKLAGDREDAGGGAGTPRRRPVRVARRGVSRPAAGPRARGPGAGSRAETHLPGMAPRDPHDENDDARDEPEVTARPTGREADALLDEDGGKVVPVSNVGGAAPTPLGHDSGGDPPGAEDDLENLAEPEPPGSPEVEAVHVERREPKGE